MTVTAVGGDPRHMAALVTISRGMMIGGGPISKIEAHVAAASSGGPAEAVFDVALASEKFATPAIVLHDPQNQCGDDIPGKLVVLVDEDGEEALVDLYLIFGEHRLRAVEFECIANDEPFVISGYWVGQQLMRRAKRILEGYQPARLEVVTCL